MYLISSDCAPHTSDRAPHHVKSCTSSRQIAHLITSDCAPHHISLHEQLCIPGYVNILQLLYFSRLLSPAAPHTFFSTYTHTLNHVYSHKQGRTYPHARTHIHTPPTEAPPCTQPHAQANQQQQQQQQQQHLDQPTMTTLQQQQQQPQSQLQQHAEHELLFDDSLMDLLMEVGYACESV
jgi:hypothetical protein